MNSKNVLRDSHTARFGLPVRHPPLWRFVLDLLTGPAWRLHHYRRMSDQMLEEALRREWGDCR